MNRHWTVLELINETAAYFNKKGIESARLDAELLLSYCLKIPRIQLYIDFERLVSSDELAAFRELVKRRAAREPVAYLVGYKDFWSLKITVEKGVLIPRPETELLIEEAIALFKAHAEHALPLAILELGTGSGAISVALAQEFRNCRIYATDISLVALKIARQNSKAHGCADSMHLVQGNALTPFRQHEFFDLIISNPPYICSTDINQLAPEIWHYEPLEALNGGVDGLDFYRHWIPRMPALLKPDRWIILEIGAGQSAAVSQLFSNVGSFTDVQTVRDYAGKERLIKARKK